MIKKLFFLIVTSLCLAPAAFAAGSQIWDRMIIPNILTYGKENSLNPGPLFILLQSNYFQKIFLGVVVLVPVVFLVHYLIWGPKKFSHDGEKILYFPLLQRAVHLLAAISFLVLIPTGLMIVFAKYLGGGGPVMMARHFHGIATIGFLLAVIPMFFFWVLDMFPTIDDIKWFFILGGYLSKEKREVPAGKFNAGQKIWFWLSTLGGLVMIITGGFMYLQDFNYGIASTLGVSQVDLLRFSVIVHNFLAMLIIAFFLTHAYMSLFAIKGAIHSMISGYKEEDEVKHLHSSFYKKIKSA